MRARAVIVGPVVAAAPLLLAAGATHAQDARDALDLTMILLPEGARSGDDVTRRIELPAAEAVREASQQDDNGRRERASDSPRERGVPGGSGNPRFDGPVSAETRGPAERDERPGERPDRTAGARDDASTERDRSGDTRDGLDAGRERSADARDGTGDRERAAGASRPAADDIGVARDRPSQARDTGDERDRPSGGRDDARDRGRDAGQRLSDEAREQRNQARPSNAAHPQDRRDRDSPVR
ncbi:MAG TPA: hypothetical protein VIN61_01850 [Gammaproteobacteria bacterium]